uniref:CYtochrome P450 family n=1 Tax=Caenorhabditis japonica TaxID=281687 RepID=A0A8R1DRN0_CAEJA
MPVFIPVVLGLVLIYIATWIPTFRKWKRHWVYGNKIPGPPAHPILGNLGPILGVGTEDLSEIFIKWADEQREKGASIMRLMLLGNIYVWPLNGKAVAKIVDSTTEINKGDDYGFFDPWLGGGLLLEGFGNRWKSHRKMLTPAFHFAKLGGYLEVFNQEAKILVDLLSDFSHSGETVDIFPYVKRCALDIICETAMGIQMGSQINHDHKYVQAVEGFNKIAVLVSFNPHLKNPFIYWLTGYKKQCDEYLHTLKTFTNKVIQERRAAFESGEVEKETSKRMMNFLDLMLTMEESNELTSEDIRQEVDTFMFAGHDTTTSSTSWACWNLAHHPKIQEKVYEEMVEVYGEDPSTDVTIEDLGKLNYLDRVLKESKRLVPPVPAFQRKLTNDLEIDGHIVPAGGNITIAPLVLHKNQLVFPDPTKFDPDRFLPDEVSKRHSYDFIPFSAGPRNCIGQKFALLNEKVMLSHIIRNFRIEPANDFKATKPCVEVVAKPSMGIPVRLIRRN